MNYPNHTQSYDFHDWGAEHSMARDFAISNRIDSELSELEVSPPSQAMTIFESAMENLSLNLKTNEQLNRFLLQVWQTRHAPKDSSMEKMRALAVSRIADLLHDAILDVITVEVESEY